MFYTTFEQRLTDYKHIMSGQITSTLLMVKPVGFRMNEETAVNNYYQKSLNELTPENVQNKALEEFNGFVEKLEKSGINVITIEDTISPDTPDSIFPNNWVSFHEDGRVGLYPMFAENRRLERREDIFEILKNDHGLKISEILDFTEFENHSKYLEGTGSMVLDRESKICYAAISIRTDEPAVDHFCEAFGYVKCSFTALQSVKDKRLPIYHTNVMMSVADNYAIICLDTIDDMDERENVIQTLENTGKTIIEISEEQKECFAGNMLQVKNTSGDKFLVMSSAAFNSLSQEQISLIETFNTIIHSSLNTIEICGGGSARCMMAEVFLPKF